MIFEIAEGGWEAKGEKRLPAIRYVGIRTGDPERLANFYQSALPIREVRRVTAPGGEAIRHLSLGRHDSTGTTKKFQRRVKADSNA